MPLPAHDWLRRHGTTFDRFYAAGMACSPARSVMYTGRHSTDTGVIDNLGVPGQADMSVQVPTLGTLLATRGYRCAYKGKWHLSGGALDTGAGGSMSDSLLEFGFSDYNEGGDDLGGAYEGHRRDRVIAAEAVDWLRTEGVAANAADTPWCLAVNFINPHDIMWATTDASLVEQRRSLRSGGFSGPPEVDTYSARWDLPDDPTWHQAVDVPTRPSAHLDYAVAQELWTGPPAVGGDELTMFRDYYLNCLREVDESVQSLIAGLREADLLDETVIVFTSDHGELAGSHGLFGKGPCAYDGNIRVPLIVVDPEHRGGRRTDAIGSQVDLVPTALGLLGVAPEPGLVGLDLSEVLGSPAGPGPRHAALFVYESLSFVDGDWARRTFVGFGADDLVTGRDLHKRGFMRTIITEHHKFSRYFAPDDHHRPASMEELSARNDLELFDLEPDPDEMANVALDDRGRPGELCGELNRLLSSLIETEIGEDDGAWMPELAGAPWRS